MTNRRIEDTAADKLDQGFIDTVKEKYDEGLWSLLGGAWNGVIQFSQSAAFKGVIIAGSALVLGSGALAAASAGAGGITTLGVPATVGQGFMQGAANGAGLLFSLPGLAIAGASGFIASRFKGGAEPDAPMVEEAQTRTQAYAKARATGMDKALAQARDAKNDPMYDETLDAPAQLASQAATLPNNQPQSRAR